MARKIQVPDGMVQAIVNKHRWGIGGISPSGIRADLEIALNWLADNGMESANNPLIEKWINDDLKPWPAVPHLALTDFLTFALREMFFAPEAQVPHRLKDLLGRHAHEDSYPAIEESLIEAYERGKESTA